MSLKRWHWKDEIYFADLTLLKGDWGKALRWMDRTFDGVKESDVGGESGAKCILIENRHSCNVIFWFPARFTLRSARDCATIAHETLHAAERVLGDRHLNTRSESGEEAYAYYIGWLYEQIYTRLKKAAR